jgi:hypothetical protein
MYARAKTLLQQSGSHVNNHQRTADLSAVYDLSWGHKPCEDLETYGIPLVLWQYIRVSSNLIASNRREPACSLVAPFR